jgi:hypothetical protein
MKMTANSETELTITVRPRGRNLWQWELHVPGKGTPVEAGQVQGTEAKAYEAARVARSRREAAEKAKEDK